MQESFVTLADLLVQELTMHTATASSFDEERRGWQGKLVELDTINRGRSEELQRRFVDLNEWQQRLESMSEGASSSTAGCTNDTVCCLTCVRIPSFFVDAVQLLRPR